jgi:hypothetical protein
VTTWLTGEDAAVAYGLSVAEIDELAATGGIPAQYQGWMLMVAAPASGPRDEIQQIVISGNPNGGTWLLYFNGAPTDPLRYNISRDALLAALEAVPTIGVGNVTVNKDGNTYDISFVAALGSQNVSELVADYSELNRGSVSITTLVQGSA